MTRWLPHPLLSGFLLAFWLLLNQSLSPGHLLLGLVLGLVGGLMVQPLELPASNIRRPLALLRLIGRVLVDIVRSNIAVARIVLGLGQEERVSGFMAIRLELRNRYGLAVLACIITATPGTIWVSFDSATGRLLIHVLDLVDEATWTRTIKHRYERLLLEIFR
ncbi:MAG TPA: Na+/H+ antiporter subunit E [Geminicoccaceae bacterium]|nr:Na+/H+ antiporter subunit E [Geminicoccus sp.]HMU52143.1 Na+/H+ antiporter subunit E [Geminicoccaceae bacterium]